MVPSEFKERIKPLMNKYLDKIYDTISAFASAIESLNDLRTGEARAKLTESMDHEKEADTIRRQLVALLERSHVDPDLKEDFFHLIKRLDFIADWIKEAARELTVIPYLEIPAPIREQLEKLLNKVVIMTDKVCKAVRALLNNEYEKASKITDEIETIEEEADEINVQIRGMLIDYADQIKPCSLAILIQEFNTDLEQAADACEDAGDYVKALIVSYSKRTQTL
ncbi:MAG: DUF47 domain-containing protein [Thermoprotei archaeon]|nr:MAG: DUF47 domain-containing protein [Thermoprotei archaeon]